ncbi:MAG: magnesium/cobalt transporter CorA [Phycisphaerae bacterium]|nr:magnesium/cobalt transporter CorA [Phycisphaerae bacterium]NUQ46221.1 magnesium/cobalt transporter CorA [Phycisphaerae bacterium]
MPRSSRKRRRAEFRRRTLPGAPPGVLIPDPDAPRPAIQLMAFGPDAYEERPLDDVQTVRAALARWPVTWVNVDGVGDTTTVAEIGRMFGFHRLAMEDAVHVHQRAKVDQYPGYYFIVARMPPREMGGDTEQISIFLGDKYVVTFQERSGGDCLDPVRLRIRTGISPVRRAGPDYLAYAILDTIVDHFFPLIEESSDRLEALESDVFPTPRRDVMARIHSIKRTLLTIRRAVWPLRDAMNTLLREQSPLITNETRVYLRDCHDHTIQIIDLVETCRDMASGLHDVYLSTLGHRTNEIMRVLTVFSAMFIPLTFIVGLYGMNFDPATSPWNMPELRWYWGYPLAMLLMAAVAATLLVYFRRKGWLTSQAAPPEEK